MTHNDNDHNELEEWPNARNREADGFVNSTVTALFTKPPAPYSAIHKAASSLVTGRSQKSCRQNLSIYLSSINHEPSILTMRRDGQKRKIIRKMCI